MDEVTKKIANGETFKERKKALQELSAQLQQDVKLGHIQSINEGLKVIYEDEGHEVLKSFEGWKKEGKRIKKGEKALMLWGAPRAGHNKETGEEYSYYPVKYVFSDKQVWENEAEYSTVDSVRLVREPSQIRRVKIGCSVDINSFVRNFYGDDLLIQESVWAVFLDRGNNTIGYSRISLGGISSATVEIRLILKYAIGTLASGVILVHNHPSGACAPSSQDNAITRRLKDAAKLMDIVLLDHIIITQHTYYSYADNGIL